MRLRICLLHSWRRPWRSAFGYSTLMQASTSATSQHHGKPWQLPARACHARGWSRPLRPPWQHPAMARKAAMACQPRAMAGSGRICLGAAMRTLWYQKIVLLIKYDTQVRKRKRASRPSPRPLSRDMNPIKRQLIRPRERRDAPQRSLVVEGECRADGIESRLCA
jgi:hypothetical protein